MSEIKIFSDLNSEVRVEMEPKVAKVLEVISSPERREILETLSEEEMVAVAALEEEKQIRCQHTHIPKLEDAGLVLYYEDSETIAKGSEFDLYEKIVEALEDLDLEK